MHPFKFIGIKLFMIFLNYPFNICKNCDDVNSIVPDIGNLCYLYS